jgi:group I intron endonuclease
LKHGESAFVLEILELVTDQGRLVEREQYWIDELDSANPRTGFNISPTAGNCLGCKHSDEARAAMSAMRKGVAKSPEGALNIGAANAKKNQSVEMRNKVRASKLRLYSSEEGKEQLSVQSRIMWERRRNAGIKWSHPQTEETRRKISAAKTGNMSADHKAAIAASNRRRAVNRAVFGPALHR